MRSDTNLDFLYRLRYRDVLAPIAEQLQQFIVDLCTQCEHIDRISTRAKSVNRFLAKASKCDEAGAPKYLAPIQEIQDQIGARIIVFYASDVTKTSSHIERYLSRRETKVMEPIDDSAFSYFGKHYILNLPNDAVPASIKLSDAPEVFELQIKTLFQHAWSEANHDLAYKPSTPLSSEQRRLLAYTSAQAWGADRAFDELFRSLRTE